MITSALISQLRRDTGDVPKTARTQREGNGSINLFNTGRFPVLEGSYTVYKNTSAQTDVTHYSFDLDNGDLRINATPSNGMKIIAQFQHANWRDKHWNEAINDGVQALNALGFFKQVVRLPRYLSAGVRAFSAPSACIDAYELLYSPASGSFSKLGTNWSYQQDANKIVLGNPPSRKLSGAISYLRNMQTYTATSATLDVKDEWLPLLKRFAAHKFFEHMAGKIATHGHATIEEGHFSFSNARTQSRDKYNEFLEEARKAKPTRPAKDIGFAIEGGGVA